MEKLWLYSENETEFKFNKDKNFEHLELEIEANKLLIEEHEKECEKDIAPVEQDRLILNGLSAVCLEYDKEKSGDSVLDSLGTQEMETIDNFLVAQNLLLKRLETEPYLYPELMEQLHRELAKSNHDLSSYEIGRFRNQYSKQILMGYFEPTSGANVATEINYALTKYAYVDRKGKDDVFEKIAKLHAQIVRIQPFMDGNKRTAFLLTNGMLKLHGLPIISMCTTPDESKEYGSALKEAIVGRDVTHLAYFFADRVKGEQKKLIDKISVAKIKQNLVKSDENSLTAKGKE